MNNKELESVVAVYRYESFAEAAYQTSFSISAISKHVQHVEDELGVRLFRRRTGKADRLLTPEGERIMPYLIQLTDTMHMVYNMAQEARSASTSIRIGSIEIMRSGAIDRILADFSLRHPEIMIENNYMHLKEILHGIDTMELDCAFLLLTRSDPRSLLEVIRQNSTSNLRLLMGRSPLDMYVAIRSSHPLAGQDCVDLNELADETFLFDLDAAQFPESVWNITQLIGRSFDDIKKKFVDSKHQNMVMEIVAAGGGVFPKSNLQKLDFPGVSFLPVKDCPADIPFLFVFNTQNNHGSFLAFRKYIEEVLKPDKV